MISWKKSGNAAWFSVLGMVVSVAAMISYYILSGDGEKSPAIVYTLTCAAIAVQFLVLLFTHTKKGEAAYNHSSILAAILAAFALEQMMLGRLEWLGGLAAHNASLASMHTSFYMTIALYAAAILFFIIAAFGSQVKE